jgi:hypothetical protein
MNVIEHLLTCLMEECAEVSKEASKANRFGIGDIDPRQPNGPDNLGRIIVELNDLMGVVRLLQSSGVLPAEIWSEEMQTAKMRKVERLMHYAEETGALAVE